MDFMKLTLGEKFRMLREQAGTSVEETAALLKTAAGTYNKIETDFIYPTESMLNKVARLYGISYDELLNVGEG
ncbi:MULTISPECIES: helix-turn-helix domain-containing protein [Pedobacter]|uniref:Helix-turn-helix domain protein n=1 Tax=Pedobacter heparinus (strain ATCC 13125 / DSM 2366 / CIP 104194 / JCM 7457 / NBRC 12017 / NCIMB 9290 / NRRL B-14731 / HIM 762-3) TaxID=485917 RepID=C6Y3Q4_PEDHD|nr:MULTISPECIES: helix-turn-helix transcriptional regulator [Pedobacter]ACU03333.1 helix-turn-helix domain protein [Pedobacter heparinus DSM 2366]MBB5440939.1 transcriptional regulator with XRE-family HTH domain [Pedobacter sp. AK017]